MVEDTPPPEPYQSLYRRFRPQRFAEVRGQEHVTGALRNAVRESRFTHAYLFSGPRGTGKTSTARILAKALNCTNLGDGEPCGACPSCLSVQQGNSLDVHELDAASNNGVDAMRDLVSRAALGTPGRWKVYIVDEVHMLSTAASNALLKTLEEPPGHVVFVLATTDPQKVLPTIRSRAQHYEFRLLGPEDLGALLAEVSEAAGLDVPSAALDQVVRRGRGSARDALSALDQVAAAGPAPAGADLDPAAEDELVEALCARDAGRVLQAVATGCGAGRDPRRLGTELLEHLREAFLATAAPALVGRPEEDHARLADQAGRLGPAGLLRAMEAVGEALIDMREALEPRVTLEVALVRVAQPDLDVSRAAVLERLERLERRVAALTKSAASGPVPAPPPPPPPPPPPAPGRPAPPSSEWPASERPAPGAPAPSRAALGSVRRGPAPPSAPTPPGPQTAPPAAPGPPPPPPGAPAASGALPTRDELTKAWGDGLLAGLPSRARARFGTGRFQSVEGGTAVFAVPNEHFLPRCQEVLADVEAALRSHFGAPVPMRLVLDAGPPALADDAPGEVFDPGSWQEEPAAVASPEDRLKRAFPGAEEVEG